MNSPDLLRLATKNFLRRKVRSFLTILGVIIGTAAIVVMLSLGIGMNEGFKKDISKMGSLNVITVDPYYYSDDGSGGKAISAPTMKLIDDKGIDDISRIKGVDAVTPLLSTGMKIVSGRYVTYGNIIGIRPDTLDDFGFEASAGRLISAEDTAAALFGSSVALNFYNPKSQGRFFGKPIMMSEMGDMNMGMEQEQELPVDVINDKLVMTFDMSYGEKNPGGGGDQPTKAPKLYKVDGVGLITESNNERDYSVYMNIEYLKKLIRENNRAQGLRTSGAGTGDGYYQAMVKVGSINDVERVQNEIKALGFGAYSLLDILKSMQKTARTMQAVLGGIGAISLLVAALGITNTMIMSIYERTREIGIMKVLGCLLGDIGRMFMIEAGIIGFMGGATGLLFSYGASALLNYFGKGMFNQTGIYGNELNNISVIPLWLAISSIIFATVVGLVSGFYPARRAMKLSALDAIRTE